MMESNVIHISGLSCVQPDKKTPTQLLYSALDYSSNLPPTKVYIANYDDVSIYGEINFHKVKE